MRQLAVNNSYFSSLPAYADEPARVLSASASMLLKSRTYAYTGKIQHMHAWSPILLLIRLQFNLEQFHFHFIDVDTTVHFGVIPLIDVIQYGEQPLYFQLNSKNDTTGGVSASIHASISH